MESENEIVSSPLASGGAGTYFEQHVSAFFLALLAVRGIPPVLKDSQLIKVEFQTEIKSWNTDDILLIAQNNTGTERKLAIQVKRQFIVSDKNEESKKAILDFWRDFKNSSVFNPVTDCLGLCVQKGTNAVINIFSGLLDNARGSSAGSSFRSRLNATGAISKKAKNQADIIKSIIKEHTGDELNDDDLRDFLSVIHVFQLDLNNDSSISEGLIRSLLSSCCSAGNPIDAAAQTWGELIALVSSESTGIPVGKSYVLNDLPEVIRNRHNRPIDINSLRKLIDHGSVVVDAIGDTISENIAINRDQLYGELLNSIHQNRILVISGLAGSGKSALAKALFSEFAKSRYCFAFRAEEFANVHIDGVIAKLDSSSSSARIFELLASQGEIIFFVESAERLLEATTRDAFTDFLRLTLKYPSMKIVITCRDYSLDTMINSIINPSRVKYSVEQVPLLTDSQLQEVAQQNTNIRSAIENPSLKRLLKLPYLLNIASTIEWQKSPDIFTFNPMIFRRKCWTEIICKKSVQKNGIDRRREQTFISLCVERAKALQPYISVSGLDVEALQGLINDNLVAESAESKLLAAPSHDVLEDWGIIQWLEGIYAISNHSPGIVAESISALPALRRGYRRWLSEKIELQPKEVDEFLLSIISDHKLPGYFRDDSIVCMLLSDAAVDFIDRKIDSLLQNDAALLIKVIHLLRVGCKSAPKWLAGNNIYASILLKPEGKAWASVVKAVNTHLDKLLPTHLDLIVGLLEDWGRSVTWEEQYPPGCDDAANIAYKLLPYLDNHRSEERLKTVLTVISSIPKANPEEFLLLINRSLVNDRDDHAAQLFKEIILPGMNGMACCRDFPQEVIKVFNATYLLTDEDIEKERSDYRYHGGIDIEDNFGIKKYGTSINFYPPSAIRGPFFQLLRYHPLLGVNFILDFINRSCTWYAEQKWPQAKIEAPWEAELKIPSHRVVKQWASSRLWGAYRGLSVNPDSFEVALMSLEKWLLELCKIDGVDVEKWLLYLLDKSNNIAITSVVSSIANAHPGKAGKAGAAILTIQELFHFDRARMIQEHSSTSMLGLFPDLNGENKVYNDERVESCKLPHRKHDLESLAIKLQLENSKEYVWEALDQHYANLPDVIEQDESHKLWRLALHRMDVRKYKAVEPESRAADDRKVYFGPGEIESDVQEIIDSHLPIQRQRDIGMRLMNWGMRVWDYDKSVDISLWRTMLEEAMEDNSAISDEYIDRGRGYIACVNVRDHWDELSEQEKIWCVEKIKSWINLHSDSEDHLIQVSRGGLLPDRASALLLPKLITINEPVTSDIMDFIALAMTHACEEVRLYAVAGAGIHLSHEHAQLISVLIGAYAMKARLEDEAYTKLKANELYETDRRQKFHIENIKKIRAVIVSQEVDHQKELAGLKLTTWAGRSAAKYILQIIVRANTHPYATLILRQLAEYLVTEWNIERKDRDYQRDYHFEQDCRLTIAKAAIIMDFKSAEFICEPIVNETENHPKEVSEFLGALISEEDQIENKGNLWPLWKKIADLAVKAPWVEKLDTRRHMADALVNKLFLHTFWKEGIRHWRKLDGNAHLLDQLVEKLAVSTFAIQAYCYFLYQIGEQSLPNGYVILAKLLKCETRLDGNSIFYLEALLGRHVYGQPMMLKKNKAVQDAVLKILDHLVEQGSSSAYKMRDDFVTPLAA